MESKRILVTGGSHGIGTAIARMAKEKGHQVVFTGRKEGHLTAAEKETGALSIQADVTSPEDNEKTVKFCQEKMGGIDVLINNAAFGVSGEIGSLDVSEMKRMFDTNIFGLVDLTNRVVPLLKKNGSGDIINIASTSGMKGHANGTAYSGSKWALRGITQCWHAELRRHDIRVMCVCPSEVQSGWGGKEPGNNSKKLFPEDIAYAIFSALEMNQRGMIPEFAVIATNPF